MTATPKFQRPPAHALTRAQYLAEMEHRRRPLGDRGIGAMTGGKRETAARLSSLHSQTTDYFTNPEE